MKISTTCLIPFYNEGDRLIETLQYVTKIKGIDDIVCVNDGSTDNSVALLKNNFPKTKLINLKNNLGKTEAVRQGLKQIKSIYVFLLDADLKNINSKEFKGAIDTMKNEPQLDMLILQRINEPFLVRLFRFDIILSGQRILKTKYLSQILNDNISHYDLEIAINEYAKRNNLRTNTFPISAINTGRKDKWGIKRSFLTNISMLKQFSKNPGFIAILKQMLYFAKE